MEGQREVIRLWCEGYLTINEKEAFELFERHKSAVSIRAHEEETTIGKVAFVVLHYHLHHVAHGYTAEAFSNDSTCLSLCRSIAESDDFSTLPFYARLFVVVPLAESEDMRDLYLAEKKLTYLSREDDAPDAVHHCLECLRRNMKTIKEFGRHPTRNNALGRTSTRNEQHYLEQAAPMADTCVLRLRASVESS
eukprot:Rmarinus@m.1329